MGLASNEVLNCLRMIGETQSYDDEINNSLFANVLLFTTVSLNLLLSLSPIKWNIWNSMIINENDKDIVILKRPLLYIRGGMTFNKNLVCFLKKDKGDMWNRTSTWESLIYFGAAQKGSISLGVGRKENMQVWWWDPEPSYLKWFKNAQLRNNDKKVQKNGS